MAMIIVKAADKEDAAFRSKEECCKLIARRAQALVADAHLAAHADLKNWRHGAVKLPQPRP